MKKQLAKDRVHILHLEDDPRDAELMGALIKAEINEAEIHIVNSGDQYRAALVLFQYCV